MKIFKKYGKYILSGTAVGVINGLFGAGGGMVAVPLLKKYGLTQKEAHENAVALILPITLISAVMYLVKDYVNLKDSLIFIPTGVIGALLGTYIIKKINPTLLKRIFGAFMIYAGIRLLLK